MAEEIPWKQPGWIEGARAWIEAELEQLGRQASGPAEQIHIRPWSTVLRVPTRSGMLFFKACAASLRHEPALTRFLAEQRPDCMLEVFSLERKQAWMLVQDGGSTLRSQLHGLEDLPRWEAALRLYAEVQIAMTRQAMALLELGTLDRRLEGLAEQAAGLFDEEQALLIGGQYGVGAQGYRRLQACLPGFGRACQRLVQAGIPASLHHDDLHDANIFLNGGQYRFADWGESCVTHPFFSLLVNLRSAAYRFGLDEQAEPIERLREAYLQAWTEFASLKDLRQTAALATRLAMVNRALTWQRVVRAIPAKERQEYEEAVPGWLQDFLEAEEREPLLG
jgi:hypothetical protein